MPERRIWLFCTAIITNVNSPRLWHFLPRLSQELCRFLASKNLQPYLWSMQWCIAKNGGGYMQRGVARGLKVPCLFMITQVSIRCQKNPEVGVRRIPANTRLGLCLTKMVASGHQLWSTIGQYLNDNNARMRKVCYKWHVCPVVIVNNLLCFFFLYCVCTVAVWHLIPYCLAC